MKSNELPYETSAWSEDTVCHCGKRAAGRRRTSDVGVGDVGELLVAGQKARARIGDHDGAALRLEGRSAPEQLALGHAEAQG